MNGVPWLTVLLCVPVGACLVLQAVGGRAAATRAITVLSTLVSAGVVAGLLIAFTQHPRTQTGPLTFQFVEQHDWVPRIGASYHLGLDGLAAWLLALDAGLFLLGALVVSVRTTERLRLYCSMLLITEAATMGVLLSLDLLLFYVFWEGMLVPLYILLANYGGRDRGRATLKFIIYTVAGSLLMLLSIIYLYFDQNAATGNHPSFDFVAMAVTPAPSTSVNDSAHILGDHAFLFTPREWAFLGFAVAFAIKVPLVPFHTWLPDSYANAPAPVLTFFAGLVSKLGAFGLIRYGLTLFPGPVRHFQWLFEGLAIASIIYGALLALSQNDIKRIVAYASISHLGFIVLGIFSLTADGLNGSIIQMVNHGIIIAALFLVVGMVESRAGTRDRRELSGLELRMPWLYALFLVITLAALGMPGMGSFVGEFTIMLGAFQASWVLALLAGVGVILAAWYMLRLHQGLMHEPTSAATERVNDLDARERLALLPLVTLMVAIGVFPKPIGDVARGSVDEYVAAAAAQQPELQVQSTGIQP